MGWDNNFDPEEFADLYPHLAAPKPRFPVTYEPDDVAEGEA